VSEATPDARPDVSLFSKTLELESDHGDFNRERGLFMIRVYVTDRPEQRSVPAGILLFRIVALLMRMRTAR
jgi:hypothetical protein